MIRGSDGQPTKPGDWTRSELEAAVEAYLQMLRLDQLGIVYNKSAVRRMLLAGPIRGRSTTEQRMQNISHVLREMGRSWIPGYAPLANIGSRTEPILRDVIEVMTSPHAAPLPAFPPVEPRPTGAPRKHPPTGYWVFNRNRRIWDAAAWLRAGAPPALFKVSDHNAQEVQEGDLGLIRLGAKPGTGPSARPTAIYAVLEVTGPPTLGPDLTDQSEAEGAAEEAWRVPARVLVNLSGAPIRVDSLPGDADHGPLVSGQQTATVAVTRRGFETVAARAGLGREALEEERDAQTAAGARRLELQAALDPERRERISYAIERGPIGARVKAARGGRCQACEALKLDAVAFLKADGTPYSEAHHVQPVSALAPGSLAARNIMVLCPNHHREIHYGTFLVTGEDDIQWFVRLGGGDHAIPRPSTDDYPYYSGTPRPPPPRPRPGPRGHHRR